MLIIFLSQRWPFYMLVGCAAILGTNEFYELTMERLSWGIRIPVYIIISLLFYTVYIGQIHYWPLLTILLIFTPMLIITFGKTPPSQIITAELGKILFGAAYVALPLALLAFMDRYPGGKWWISFLLLVVFAGDTGAFYSGRLFGKHKLYESISPGKTWEGAVGGTLSSLFVAFWFMLIVKIHPVGLGVFFLVIIISAFAQCGDLAESLIKRSHKKKDSGGILPGHGGILDRIDGLLFSIPVLYFFLILKVIRL